MTTEPRRLTFRAYPNKRQETLLAQTFGCTRVVYNTMIHLMVAAYKSGNKLTLSQAQKMAGTNLRHDPDYAYLKIPSSVPLQQSSRHCGTAFTRFFKGASGHPKFKKKSGQQSAEFTKAAITEIRYEKGSKWGYIRLAKFTEPMKFRVSRDFDPEKVSSLTVIKRACGRYELSMVYAEEVNITIDPETVRACGVDLGLDYLAVLNYDDGTSEKVGNPRFFRKAQRKLARLQRKLSGMVKGSNNYRKQQLKIAKQHQRIKDQRAHLLHDLTSRIVDENQVICLEDLNVSGMAKSTLSKSIHDASFGRFRQFTEYKAKSRGKDVLVVSRYFPSTQLCSSCGHQDGKKPLHIREWICSGCGSQHDRDINAAINIRVKGCEMLGSSP